MTDIFYFQKKYLLMFILTSLLITFFTWVYFAYYYNTNENKFVASLKIFPISLTNFDNMYDDIQNFEKKIFNSIDSNSLDTFRLREYRSIVSSFSEVKELAIEIKDFSYENYRQTLIVHILDKEDENFQYYDEKNKFSFLKFINFKISFFNDSKEIAKKRIEELALTTYQETEEIFQYKKKFLFHVENIINSYEELVNKFEKDVNNLKRHYDNAYAENITSIETNDKISLVEFYDQFYFKIKELKIDTNSSYLKYLGYINLSELIYKYEKFLDKVSNNNNSLKYIKNDFLLISEKIKYVDINIKNIKISVLETIDIKFYYLVILSLFIFILQISILVFYNYFKYSE